MVKKALLTGASKGIGLALAQRLTQEGYFVYGIARDFSQTPPIENFMPIEIDLSKTHAIEKVIAPIAKVEPFELLVNNAGFGLFEPHEELSSQEIIDLINVNLTAPIVLTNLLLRRLKQTQGSIINITSIEALKASKFAATYSAAKAGLRHFGQSLFEEVRKSGVKVITLNPDLTQSSFFDTLHFEPAPDADCSIPADTIAQEILHILHLPKESVITEITIRPQRVGISKKK